MNEAGTFTNAIIRGMIVAHSKLPIGLATISFLFAEAWRRTNFSLLKNDIMTKIMFSLFFLLFTLTGVTAFSQKYKSASDTVKLNKEIVEVSNDVAEITAKLTIAQNNLPGYTSKASQAKKDAQVTAQNSSDQAYKATNGDLGDAKSARKKAKKASNDAEDAADAKDDVKSQEKRIDKLTVELLKKQKKLNELDAMLTTIRVMHQ